MTTQIQYVVGDATKPQGLGNKLIIHVCNDVNAWGAGFVVALSKKWPETKKRYHAWYKKNEKLELGTIQAVQVEKDIVVVNMIGQRDIKTVDGVPPIRYGAIDRCLSKVSDLAIQYNTSIHAPKFGAGLAGGDWNFIEKLIKDHLCLRDIEVTIYEWEPTAQTVKTAIAYDHDPLEDLFK